MAVYEYLQNSNLQNSNIFAEFAELKFLQNLQKYEYFQNSNLQNSNYLQNSKTPICRIPKTLIVFCHFY